MLTWTLFMASKKKLIVLLLIIYFFFLYKSLDYIVSDLCISRNKTLKLFSFQKKNLAELYTFDLIYFAISELVLDRLVIIFA